MSEQHLRSGVDHKKLHICVYSQLLIKYNQYLWGFAKHSQAGPWVIISLWSLTFWMHLLNIHCALLWWLHLLGCALSGVTACFFQLLHHLELYYLFFIFRLGLMAPSIIQWETRAQQQTDSVLCFLFCSQGWSNWIQFTTTTSWYAFFTNVCFSIDFIILSHTLRISVGGQGSCDANLGFGCFSLSAF